MTTEQNGFSAETLYQFERITDNQLSPDGQHIIYSVERIERKTEKKYQDLWVVSADGDSTPRRFTYGDWVDTAPRWSPDGHTIAFLSNRKDGKQPQLYLLPFHGGEARLLAELKGTISSFAWSPNGGSLVCGFRKADADVLERQEDKQKQELGVVVRHIKRGFYKANGVGYLPQEKNHIWRIDVASGETMQLTDGDYDEQDPVWSPDGTTILFASNRSDDPDMNPDAVELYTVPADGGEMTLLPTNHVGTKFLHDFSPDGNWISYVGRRHRLSPWQNSSLYLVPAGGGVARNMTADADLDIANRTGGDVAGATPLTTPVWSPDSSTIYFQISRFGDQPLMALNVASETFSTVVGECIVGRFNFDAAHTRLAYFCGQTYDPGNIWVQHLDSGANIQLTRLNNWLADAPLGTVTEQWIKSADGTAIQGWIMTPPDFDPAHSYPTIIDIHGGPQTQLGNWFMHQYNYLAAHGYVIAYCNPRGSQGYGEAFAGAIFGRWGTVDYDDLTAWFDTVAALPYVAADRMGVMGGSYGGYMTVTVIGRTDRFKAAIAQRMVSNSLSMYGGSDMNWYWNHLIGNGNPWEDFEKHWHDSPMSGVGNINTPTLIMHSEDDYRTRPEQSEQVYVALRSRGVPTELLLFPSETHELSRTGRTDRRVARLEHMLHWFDRYLKEPVEGASDG